jgi:chromosomal replication initiation ATPase DnaA
MLNYYAAPGLIRNQDRINATIIIEKVSKYFDLTIPGIVSPSRMAKVVMARQISQYILRNKLKMPYKAIGLLFNRDHTSVIHSVKYIRQQLEMKHPADIITHLINIENQLLW